MREHVIESEMDDDVQTDEELCEGAIQMMKFSLREAIESFVNDPQIEQGHISNLQLWAKEIKIASELYNRWEG